MGNHQGSRGPPPAAGIPASRLGVSGNIGGVPTKVAELRQDHRGDRRRCPTCAPPDPRKTVTMDRLWAWSVAHPGEAPFR